MRGEYLLEYEISILKNLGRRSDIPFINNIYI
jgi:hypothetical protein